MSYRMRISAKSRKAGRFISKVHHEIQKAFIASGKKQIAIARLLEVDRSAINKQLTGKANLTLRSIADLAWAMDADIDFTMSPRKKLGANYAAMMMPAECAPQIANAPLIDSGSTVSGGLGKSEPFSFAPVATAA